MGRLKLKPRAKTFAKKSGATGIDVIENDPPNLAHPGMKYEGRNLGDALRYLLTQLGDPRRVLVMFRPPQVAQAFRQLTEDFGECAYCTDEAIILDGHTEITLAADTTGLALVLPNHVMWVGDRDAWDPIEEMKKPIHLRKPVSEGRSLVWANPVERTDRA